MCYILLTVGGVAQHKNTLRAASGSDELLQSISGPLAAIMHLMRLEAAVVVGFFISQMSSLRTSSAASDCLASVETCMSDLCRKEEALHGDACDGEGCRIKGSEVCNMTIQAALDQFPPLRGCVCSWQQELCGSVQALAAQCQRRPEPEQKTSPAAGWQSSSLSGYAYDGSGSCLEQIAVCLGDAVCNRHLAPVLEACVEDQRDRCQRATRLFYGSMPHNVAEMLAMCECEASDASCEDMRSTLQSGRCGERRPVCQETVQLCVEDDGCRGLLETLQDRCWRVEGAKCTESELQSLECLTLMDPELIVGADPECRKAFVATLGTALHCPCSCNGVHGDDLRTCNMIQDVLHNRSHFKTSWQKTRGSSKPPEFNRSEQSETWSAEYLMYALATVLLVGVVVVMPLVLLSKIWITTRTDENKFHPAQKRNVLIP